MASAEITGQRNLTISLRPSNQLDVTLSGTVLNVMYVSGPQGPVGPAGPSGQSGPIGPAGSGVSSINLQTGAVTFYGTGGNLFISSENGQVFISGSGLATDEALLQLSGYLQNQIYQTGSIIYDLVTGLSGNGVNTAALSGYVNQQIEVISGQVYQTGSYLYNTIIGLSGDTAINYATKTQLTDTGVILGAQIDSLSGFVQNTSGYLQAQINAGGQAVSTGSLLYNLITGLSGQADINYATKTEVTQTGALLESVIASTGQQAWTATDNNSINLSGSLQSTGSSLYSFTTGVSGYLLDLISEGAGGVASINGISGFIFVQGVGNVFVTTVGQDIIISGNTGDYALFALKSDVTQTGISLINSINSLSGWTYTENQFLQSQITNSGITLINYINSIETNISGALYQTGYILDNKIDTLSGEAVLKFGNQLISGEKIFINPALFVSGLRSSGSIFFNTGNLNNALIDGEVNWSNDYNSLQLGMNGGNVIQKVGFSSYYRVKASGFIDKGQVVMAVGVVGNSEFIIAAPANGIGQRGELIMGVAIEHIQNNEFGNIAAFGSVKGIDTLGYQLGDILYYNPSVVGGLTATPPPAPNAKVIVGIVTSHSSNGSIFVRVTAGSALGSTDSNVSFSNLQDGDFIYYNAVSGYWTNQIPTTGQISGISNYALNSSLQATGSTLNTHIFQTGADLYSQIYNSGQLLFNRDSFISGALANQIATTGGSVINYVNSVGNNLSGNLGQTGAALIARDNSISGILQTQIDSISAGTGSIGNNVVYTSGTQFISGTKYFLNNTYIDNLFVTGTQTVINTQDVYVANNWMILNSTGGARDSAIFVSTGFTGMNAIGGVLGFDVPSNTWRFGIGGYMTDLMSLPTIASVGELLASSGGLEVRIALTGSNAISYTNIVGQILSGNISVTGATLVALNLATSGALNNSIYQTGADLYNQIYNTGQLLWNRDTSISGGLQTQIANSGNAAIVYTNSVGNNLSGNLTQTGQMLYSLLVGLSGDTASVYATKTQLVQTGSVLDAKINSLSGFTVNVISGGLDERISQTGSASVAQANSIGQVISGNLTETGATLIALINASAGGVSSLNGQSGILTLSATDGLTVIDLPGVILISGDTSISGALTQTGALIEAQIDALSGFVNTTSGSLNSTIINTGNASVTHANSIGVTISGNLTATGQVVYSMLTGMSGNAENIYATKSQLAQTGSTLSDKINTLSGFTVNVSGALSAAIVQTGASATNYANSIGQTISGALTQTGVLLGSQINALSGFTLSTSGAINSTIVNTGNAAITFATNLGLILSGNLTQTGQTLYALITGMSGDTSTVYATKTQLTQTGSTLDSKINTLSGFTTGVSGYLDFKITATGVAATNYANGIGINLSGNLTTTGQTLQGRIDSLSGFTVNVVSGGLETRIIQTGNAAITYSNSIGQTISGNLSQTGATLISLINAAAGSVRTLNGQSGVITLVGTGGLTVISGGFGLILISGDTSISGALTQTGVILGSQINALSGFTNSVSGVLNTTIINTGNAAISHANTIGNIISGNLTQTGITLLSADLNLSGVLTGRIYQTGIDLYNQLYNSGQNLWNRDASISGGLQAQINNTGNAAIAYTNSVGVAISGNLTITGQTLYSMLTGMSGDSANVYATKVQLTQTGVTLDSKVNVLSGFVTGVSGSLDSKIITTGNAAVTHANGIGINLSGNLAQTGATLISREDGISGTLQTQINAISAGTGSISRDVVYTSGTQFISGTKYFVGNTYIDTLFVTGKQIVVNTQDVYVGNNWMILNSTGGARDSAIFVATGFTGMNATGGVIGFDVPSNTWRFGIGGYMTDLNVLPTIASLGDLTAASGGLETRIALTGSSSISYTNAIGQIISGNLSVTGATLISLNASTSGALTGRIYQTGIDLYNQIYNTGQIIISSSGGLEARITATGNSAIAHANGIGVNLSGNLTSTGSTLNSKINSLSGYVDSQDYATGRAAISYTSGVSGVLQTQINALPTTAYVNGIGINLSGNLTQTGITLSNYISGVGVNLSGNLISTGNSAVAHANSIGSTISGNLTVTGQTLNSKIDSLSGFVNNVSGGLEARITQTGSAAINFANGIGAIISGNLTQTGVTLWNRDASISGGLEVRITATGTAAVTHANGIGINLSGNLAQTGATLGAQIAALSGYVTGANGGVYSYLTGLLPTGLDTYYINYPVVFGTIPRISVTMELGNMGYGMYGVSISGRSTTGFWALLTDTVDTSGVFLDVLVKT